MMTPLTAGSLVTGSYQQLALDNLVNRAKEDFLKKQEKVTESYNAKAASLDATTERYIKLSSNVKNAEVAIENGQEGITKIEQFLLDMRGALAGIEQTGEASDYYLNQFDEALRQINVTADLYSASFNPIGRVQDRMTWDPNVISFDGSFGGNTTRLNGVYVGADFRIETSNGTWVPDLGSQTMTRYSNYNGTIPTDKDSIHETVSLLTGITKVTYDGATGLVNLDLMEDGAPVTDAIQNGSLVKGGLGLLGSWNYPDLKDADPAKRAAAIQQALKDLDYAAVQLDSAKAQMTSNMSTVSRAQARIDGQMDDLKTRRKDFLYDQLEEQTKLQQEFATQVDAMQRNLEAMSQQQQSYLNVFASTVASFGNNNPLFVDQMA